ncbi:MAG: hypothetical protein ABI036_16895 [Fibrobacteria bacterium]
MKKVGIAFAAFFSLTLSSRSATLDWTIRNPAPSLKPLTSATWLGDRLVANFSESYFSTQDGITWSALTGNPVATDSLFSAVKTDSQHLALGGGTRVLISSDSLRWSIIRSGPGSALRSLAWTGTQLVAVGDAGTILTSPDAASWTTRTTGNSNNLVFVKWTGSEIVVVDAQATLMTSPDGLAWNQLGASNPCEVTSVTWTENQLVAACAEGRILTSSDFKTWAEHSLGVTGALTKFSWAGTQFLALVSDTLVTSPDGITWTKRNPGFHGLSDFSWRDGHFVLIGANGEIGISTDGADWSVWNNKWVTRASLNSITWTGNQFVAVGDKGTIVTSENGVTWQQRFSDATITLVSVTWAGNQLIAAGSDINYSTVIMTSPDGIDWKVRHPNLLATVEVKWDGKQIIAVGVNYAISYEGIAWDLKDFEREWRFSAGKPWHFHSLAWSGSTYVAMASDNESPSMFTSDDGGDTWSARIIYAPSLRHSLIWAGSQFVLVGSSLVYTSPDGHQWSKQSASPGALRSVIWSGSQLIAAGPSGDIFSSTDGVTWSNDRADTHSSAEPILLSVVSTDTQYVAVGERGSILTASHEPTVSVGKRISRKENLSARISNNRLSIKLDAHVQGTIHVTLYSLAGKRLMAITAEASKGGFSVPCPILEGGLYLVEVQTPNAKSVRTLSLVQ